MAGVDVAVVGGVGTSEIRAGVVGVGGVGASEIRTDAVDVIKVRAGVVFARVAAAGHRILQYGINAREEGIGVSRREMKVG